MSVFTIVSTADAFEVVPLDQIRDELGLGEGADDVQLTELIESATHEVQDETYWTFARHTLRLTLDKFPSNGLILLPMKPVSSVSSITYYDNDNASQTLASSNYRLVTLTSPAQIELTEDGSWPSTYIRGDAVQVNILAGYATLAEVPAQAKRAIKEKVKSAYNGCGDMSQLERCINGLRWYYENGY